MNAEFSEDAIADAISAGRPFELEIGKPTTQRLTDVHWVALKAARRVGRKVSVRVTRTDSRAPLTVRVSPL